MYYTTPTLNNKYFIRIFFVGTLLLSTILVNACDKTKTQHIYSVFAFGTLIDITLYDVNQQQADVAFDTLQQLFDKNHMDWSPWTDGDLSQLNKQLSVQTEIVIPEHLIPIIKTSIKLSQLSKNNYNPAIGKLINLWQFHKYQDKDTRPPHHDDIQKLVNENPQMSNLSFNTKNQLVNTNPAVALNFGAFAKGYAITLGMNHLKDLGIRNAIINAGGDLSVMGKHGNRAWNIGIRHPRKNETMASIEVSDNESVFTSGDYERSYIYQNKRYHHILNPETGYPTDDAQSVTVIHPDAGYADAAATALFVAGNKHWQDIAKSMGLRHVMLIDAAGDIHLTPAMKNRINFINKSPSSRIIVSQEL